MHYRPLNIRSTAFLFFTLFSPFMLMPWESRAEALNIAQALEDKLSGDNITIEGEPVRTLALLKATYAKRKFQPVWTDKKNINGRVKSYLEALSKVSAEGLDPADYHPKAIKALAGKSKNKADKLAELEILVSDSLLSLASHYNSGKFNPITRQVTWSRNIDLTLASRILDGTANARKIQNLLQSLLPAHLGYKKLKAALVTHNEIQEKGGWPTVRKSGKLQKGDRDGWITTLRKRLFISGDLPNASQSNIFDEEVEKGLIHFQERHGLTPDGILGATTVNELNTPVEKRIVQIKAGLDRLRALKRDKVEDRYLLVNIPDFKLNVMEKGKPVLTMPVIVGRVDRKTPLMMEEMTYLVLSPYWNVPRSIAVKDKLPEIQKDPGYLSRMGMMLYEEKGSEIVEIPPESIDWSTISAETFNYRITQKPGTSNALGLIKFMFPNDEDVYLHDTPDKGLFSRDIRTFSSGCVRIQKPIVLAEYLLKDKSEWNSASIDGAMRSGTQKIVKLSESIPIHLIYLTSWVDTVGKINFRNDIYSYDGAYATSEDLKKSDHTRKSKTKSS